MEINATLIGQLITFALLVWFTMKYVWPPITKAMTEREKQIAAGLEASSQSQRALEEAGQTALNIIRDAKQEATRVIDQAHKRSVQIIEEAKEAARIESKRIVDHAEDQIALEVSQTKEALRKQLAGLAVLGAEKILRRNLDASANAALLDEFAAEI
ncbi:MAG TPA: F0F1 ATP synthase subunit B [Gammaproteobacteria bacterium]|nr:F0F1 ATP synthase subunit B [Gammaproteobacteria bacterium]